MTTPQRNLELESTLVEHPDDQAAYLVYADWLQAKGDPRGELIMLHHAGKKAEAAAFIQEHEDHFLGPLTAYAEPLDGSGKEVFGWHMGFLRSVRLSYDSNEAGNELSLPEALQALLTHPSGALVTDLLVPINMLDDGCYFEPVCQAIGQHRAPSLRRLRLGEYNFAGPRNPSVDYDYEISWTKFGDISGMWQGLPRLEHLVLQGCLGEYGGPSNLGSVALPRLAHIEVISGGIDQANVRALAAAAWPELRHMDLWLGSSDYGYSGSVGDLAPILAGKGLPKLKHLGLMNAEITDELVTALLDAKVLPQLEALSLALGTMTDAAAQVLAANRAAFGHLRVLDLEHNYLSDESQELLKDLCADVRLGEQRGDEDGDRRYVAVGE